MIESHVSNDLSIVLKPVQAELYLFDDELFNCLNNQNYYLDKILKHIINSGGKRLRPAMVFLIAKALNNSMICDAQTKLAFSLELIHTATLIHDDVVDEAEERRNSATINALWGDKTAIIAGDYLLSKALNLLMQLENREVVEIFSNNLSEICIGEIQQLSTSSKRPSFEEYIEKSKRKTALLFSSGAKSSAILSNSDEEIITAMNNFALNFGISFQIVDDVLNFSPNTGKPAGLDLKNGIYTAPVIFAMEENSQIEMLIEEQEIEKVLQIINESKALKKSKDLAIKYANSAIKELQVLKPSIYKASLVELANYNIQRCF